MHLYFGSLIYYFIFYYLCHFPLPSFLVLCYVCIHVVVIDNQVEDIVDTGHTLSRVSEHLKSKGASSVSVCTLLDKPTRRKVNLQLVGDEKYYRGFEVWCNWTWYMISEGDFLTCSALWCGFDFPFSWLLYLLINFFTYQCPIVLLTFGAEVYSRFDATYGNFNFQFFCWYLFFISTDIF